MFEKTIIPTHFGNLVGVQTPYGVIVLVDPKWLDVDNGVDGYQRPFDPGWAETIARDWDRSKFRPVSIRLRKGRLFVTNGQHGANAAVMAGEELVIGIINNGVESRQVEAREFVDAQTKVKRMRPYHVYRASLVAGDVDALIVRKVTNELGIETGLNPGPNILSSISAARLIARERDGEQKLRDVLEVALVWDREDLNRFKYEMLMGISKALDASTKDNVRKNAKRRTATALYRTASIEAGGKGYVTISNIAAALGKSRRRTTPLNVIHEDAA